MKEIKVFKDSMDRYSIINKLVIHETEEYEEEARFAFDLCRHWGMVACKITGETKQGRIKLEVLTPEELAQRSFDTARLMYAEARKRGLVVTMPSVAELYPEPPPTDKGENEARKFLSTTHTLA